MGANLAVVTNGKTPLQALDQSLNSLALVFFDSHHAPNAAGTLDGATGFGDRNRLLVFVDPAIKVPAVLDEQTQIVVRLARVRIHSRRTGGATTSTRAIRQELGDGLDNS
ncbi:MAG: hypothetical protein J2P17_32415 [Mycobacterium sp.]|nr:hypothetical protein [Mycobacterium sp.]